MRNNFPKRPSGSPLHTLSTFWGCFRCFCNPSPSFEAVYSFDCSHRRVAVDRYRMICLVPYMKYKKRILLRCIYYFESDLRETGRNLTQSFDKSPYTHRKIKKALTIWTICAFRVINPHQWSLTKQCNLKSWKVMVQKALNKLKPNGV